ncbi:MAG: glycosyltransferase family 9 protein [Acidobacteria bacterium]|nr:glycosyltransferase family 9 protein [Acidobacteriota bacterium]
MSGIRLRGKLRRTAVDLAEAVSRTGGTDSNNQPRFLIIRLGSLGDVIHGIPAAAALRRRFPQAHIDWLVDPRYVELLDLVRCIDRPIAFDPRDFRIGGAHGWSVLKQLRAAHYDAVIDLQGLLKSAVLARLVGAPRTIGFPRVHLRESLARVFYTDAPDPGAAAHVIEKNLGLLRPLGVSDRAVHFPLRIPRTATVATIADRFADGYAIVNPGAAWPNKRWPASRFGAVAASIRREHGLRSVVLWGPGEEALAASVVASAQGAAEAALPTTMTDVVGLARAARVMISGDTGPLHMAGAVGTPLVALFGPTFPERNGPWSPRDVVVSRVAQCSCPYERRCRRERPCIDDIGVGEVVDAVRQRLATHG